MSREGRQKRKRGLVELVSPERRQTRRFEHGLETRLSRGSIRAAASLARASFLKRRAPGLLRLRLLVLLESLTHAHVQRVALRERDSPRSRRAGKPAAAPLHLLRHQLFALVLPRQTLLAHTSLELFVLLPRRAKLRLGGFLVLPRARLLAPSHLDRLEFQLKHLETTTLVLELALLALAALFAPTELILASLPLDVALAETPPSNKSRTNQTLLNARIRVGLGVELGADVEKRRAQTGTLLADFRRRL